VVLSETLKDAWGIPAPKMIYSLDQNTRDMIRHGIGSATRAFEEAGAHDVVSEDLVVYAGFHLLGTARMGLDRETSVVDRHCRAHDIQNLMVVDGSVFVTAAALNPTPTIQAVALYAADALLADRRSIGVAA
jgi:choline dehydrogenase-like flavoprotein